MSGFLNYLIDELKSVAASGIADTIQFVAAFRAGNFSSAMDYAIQSLATLFVLALIIKYLWAFAKKLDHIITLFRNFTQWLIDSVKGISTYASRLIATTAKKWLRLTFRGSTYVGFIDWCAMMHPNTSKRLRAFDNGDVLVSYQRSMGMATLAVTIWSACGFAYGIHAATRNSSTIPEGLIPTIILTGSILYGILLFLLDRSIIAPYIDKKIKHHAPGFWGKFKEGVSEFNLMLSVKFILRITVAVMVAKFTALPITIMLFGTGIQGKIEELNKVDTNAIATKIAAVQTQKSNYLDQVASGQACVNAINAAKQHADRLDKESRTCNGVTGNRLCYGSKSIALESKTKDYEASKSTACSGDQEKLKNFDDQIATLKSQEHAKWKSPPDLLIGGHILDLMSKDEKNTSSFNPIGSAFWLLLAVELFPVLMKIWQRLPEERRGRSDRRVSATVISFPDRRTISNRRMA